ncbi:T9SS type A sorting domain-containing protein [Ferruginibacter yonginensis]|uniref:T9SS type A sorting domain-containing protein n=1 Tax=Ferruginibacter yonginensis TaxID=1310416 RepID=A0ABV8QPB0_9BACT
MKSTFTLLLILCVACFNQVFAQNPTIYASVASGSWASTSTWETFTGNASNTPGAQGTGTPAVSVPSGTHYVYIRSGHTVTMAASRNTLGLTVESGATLLGGGAAFVLKVNNGGTGFTSPLDFGIINNGTIGQASESTVLEIPVAARNVLITGTGNYILGRCRIVGSNPNPVNVTFDANVTFNIAGNYALSAIYNPGTTDNYTVNINAGKTVTITSANGYFNNNSIGSGSGFGTYTYNINGTLNLAASTQTATNLTAISPTSGVVNLNIGATGKIITGAAFNASPTLPGVANINIAAGGELDASLATVFNFNGNSVITNGTNSIKRVVPGDGTRILFPIKTSTSAVNNAIISRLNTSGTSATYTASVKNTFDNAPADLSKSVQKQWDINITGAPSADDTLRLSWTTADQGASFDPAGTVSIMHYAAGAYEYFPATVTGSGTAADPYVARATGITSYSPFGVTSLSVLPLTLTSFTANFNGKQNDIRWTTDNEIGVQQFELLRSTNAVNFTKVATVAARNNATNAYSWLDAANNNTTYYRLKMIDLDGKVNYSNIITVKAQKTTSLSVFPNPTTSNITLNYPLLRNNASVTVYSLDGRKIMQQQALKNTTTNTVDVSSLKAGTYNVTIINNDVTTHQIFIKK